MSTTVSSGSTTRAVLVRRRVVEATIDVDAEAIAPAHSELLDHPLARPVGGDGEVVGHEDRSSAR
jgi:hypothetical protein